MSFAAAVLVGFFAVWVFCPHRLYGPSDFRSDRSYLALNKRVGGVEEYAKLIDQKIESMPFYQFARLSECGIRLFLALYYEDWAPAKRPLREVLAEVRDKFTASEVAYGEDQLIKIGWAARSGESIAPTPEGREAHRVLVQFIYARWA